MNTKVENKLGGEKGEHLITKRELACRLRRTVRTITNWQRRGIIPYVRWRHAVYFDWAAVQASLECRGGEGEDTARAAQPAELPPALSREEHWSRPIRLPVYQMRDEKCASRKRTKANAAGSRPEAQNDENEN